jgi:tape measure domain-containing protein
LNRDYNKLQGEASRHGTKVGKAFGDSLASSVKSSPIKSVVTGVFQGVGQQLTQIAVDIGRSFGSAISSSVAASADFERLNKTLLVVAGSSAAVAKEQAFLSSTISRMSLPVKEATQSYVELMAASKGTALEGERTQRIFMGLTLAGKALGLSNEAQARAFNAVQQMMSKGKVSAEELRGQLGEALPGAYQLFAKSIGVSAAQLDKLLENGQVGTDALIHFTEALIRTYGNAGNATKTLSDEFTTFNNKIVEAQKNFGDLIKPVVLAALENISALLSGIGVDLDSARGLVSSVAKWLSDSTDEAAALGSAIGDVVNSAMTYTKDLAQGIGDYFDRYPAMLKAVNTAAGFLNDTFDLMKATVNAIGATFNSIFEVIGKIAQKLDEMKFFEWWEQSSQNVVGGLADAYNHVTGNINNQSGVTQRAIEKGKTVDRNNPMFRALIGQESGGNSNARNTRTSATGISQIMPANIPSWTKEALGRSYTREEFARDPEAQYRTTEYHLNKMYQANLKRANGDADLAERMTYSQWYSGDPNKHLNTDRRLVKGNEPTVKEYVDSVVRKRRGVGGSGMTGAMAARSLEPEPKAATLPPWQPLDAGSSKKNADAAQRAAERALREGDANRSAVRQQAQSDWYTRFDQESDKGRIGLSGSDLKLYDFDRAGARTRQGFLDNIAELSDRRRIKMRDGKTGGVDYTAAIRNQETYLANHDKITAAQRAELEGTAKKERAEEDLEKARKQRQENNDKRQRAMEYSIQSRDQGLSLNDRLSLAGLTGGNRVWAENAQSQAAELRGVTDEISRLNEQLRINKEEGVDDGGALAARIDFLQAYSVALGEVQGKESEWLATQLEQEWAAEWLEQQNEEIERQNDLAEELREKRLESLSAELDAINAAGDALSNAFKSAITGTKSLGEVALNLLSELSGRLLDVGLNSILGSAGSGKGILGSLFNGLLNGGGEEFGIFNGDLGIPGYASGTPYVPTNQLAYLHQGEAVIPAKHNRNNTLSNNINVTVNNAPGEGAMNNNQANKLTEQVRRVVEAEMLRQRRPGGMMY